MESPWQAGTSDQGHLIRHPFAGSPGGGTLPFGGGILASLPITLIGPSFGVLHQTRPDGIHTDVVPFFGGAFISAKSMVEKTVLPLDPMVRGHPSLPVGEHFAHVMAFGECHDAMKVIWHRQNDFPSPIATLLPEFDRLDQRVPYILVG
jgi:hypothetical protein